MVYLIFTTDRAETPCLIGKVPLGNILLLLPCNIPSSESSLKASSSSIEECDDSFKIVSLVYFKLLLLFNLIKNKQFNKI